MNRRKFLSSVAAIGTLATIPLIKSENTPLSSINSQTDCVKYAEYQRIWTPEEITEAGFVYMPCVTFMHQWNDPQNPILKSYTSKNDDLERPMVVKSWMYAPWYIKEYDVDKGTRRGIHNINDYHYKKDIFKPMILKYMKDRELHYVYEVKLGDSPCIWEDPPHEHPGLKNVRRYNYMFPVFIRGARIPKRV